MLENEGSDGGDVGGGARGNVHHQITCGKHLRAQRVTISRFVGGGGEEGRRGGRDRRVTLSHLRVMDVLREKERGGIKRRSEGGQWLSLSLSPTEVLWERSIRAAGGGRTKEQGENKKVECMFKVDFFSLSSPSSR